MNSFSSAANFYSNKQGPRILSIEAIGTIYCATQIKWTYSGTPFNVDIKRTNGSTTTTVVTNYSDSSFGIYLDMTLAASTSYIYNLYATGSAASLASVSITTPSKPATKANSVSVIKSGSTNIKRELDRFNMYMAVNHNGSNFMFYGQPGNLYYTKDYGVNTTIKTIDETPSIVGLCMNWTGTFMYILVVITTPEVRKAYYTMDSGTTWNTVSVSLTGTTSTGGTTLPATTSKNSSTVLQCNHIGNRILYYCANSSSKDVFLSTNWGMTYTSIKTFTQNEVNSTGYAIYATPDFSKFIAACGRTGSDSSQSVYIIGSSANYGKTFSCSEYDTTRITNEAPNTTIGAFDKGVFGLGYDPDNDVFYATIENTAYYYKSDTTYSNWSSISNNGYFANGSTPSLKMSFIAASIRKAGVWTPSYSTDKGVNWSSITGSTNFTGNKSCCYSSADGGFLLFLNGSNSNTLTKWVWS